MVVPIIVFHIDFLDFTKQVLKEHSRAFNQVFELAKQQLKKVSEKNRLMGHVHLTKQLRMDFVTFLFFLFFYYYYYFYFFSEEKAVVLANPIHLSPLIHLSSAE